MRARFISPGAYSPWLGRETPSAADRAEAERIVAGYEQGKSAAWRAFHREEAVNSFARIVMQKRLEAEHRAAVDQSRMRDVA